METTTKKRGVSSFQAKIEQAVAVLKLYNVKEIRLIDLETIISNAKGENTK